jgi:ribonuclease P protein component
MLPKSARLTVADIETLSQGKSVFGTLISVRYIPAPALKFSVSVSKKVAKTAVLRNRMRRRLYGALEGVMKEVKNPLHIMIMPKKECFEVPFKALTEELRGIIQRLNK